MGGKRPQFNLGQFRYDAFVQLDPYGVNELRRSRRVATPAERFLRGSDNWFASSLLVVRNTHPESNVMAHFA